MTSRSRASRVLAVCAAALSVPCASCGAGDGETTASGAAAIVGGMPATAFPEAVVVTASGFVPCSGVVLAPYVVLTAGHCRSPGKKYAVLAPNAPGAQGQQASGSNDWTTYDGDPATSSDTLLIFLDSPIRLATYPVLAPETVAANTAVVDVGRTLNGTLTMNDYVSPTVTILGPGTPLGFPYNYEATPDISQDGDSGGPIELVSSLASPPHVVVAIVDTDTVEQDISEASPIDLFARLDGVREAILAQIAADADGGAARGDGGATDASSVEAGGEDSGGATKDAATRESRDAARGDGGAAGEEAAASGGSCAVAGRGSVAGGAGDAEGVMVAGIAWMGRRRRRGGRP